MPFPKQTGPGTLVASVQASALTAGGGQDIIQYTTPNDGKDHLVSISGYITVTSALTGGTIQFGYGIGSTPLSYTTGTAGTWPFKPSSIPMTPVLVPPNTNVNIQQLSGVSAGAATVNAQIWST